MFILEKNGCSHVDRSTTTQKKRLKKGEEKNVCMKIIYIFYMHETLTLFVVMYCYEKKTKKYKTKCYCFLAVAKSLNLYLTYCSIKEATIVYI